MGAAAAKGGKPKATCAEAGGFAFAFVAIEPSVRERGRGAAPCETTRGETTMRVAAAAASARVGLQVDEPCYATPGVHSGAVAMPLVGLLVLR